MKQMHKEKHQFALFVQDFRIDAQVTIIIKDADTVHRINSVLRLAVGDELVVFNNVSAFFVTITQLTKKLVTTHIVRKEGIPTFVPEITVLLPLLKKEALEDALYACVELGVTTIMLVTTDKTHSIPFSPAYHQRLTKIIHGAQEQAKQYVPVLLEGPLSLSEAVKRCQNNSHKIVALQGGGSLAVSFVKNIPSVTVAIGPEADFSAGEKTYLREQGFHACSLGPTVLRAQQAVTVLVGSIRVLTV